MVLFEFGQDRLTEPHALSTFELAQGAIKGAFVLFSTTLLGLVGFVLQNHSFSLFRRTSWRGKPRQPLCGLVLSESVFWFRQSAGVG